MAAEQARSFLEIVVPVVEYEDVNGRAYEPPPRPRTISGRTITLVPNFKTISPPFMEVLAQKLGHETGAARAHMHNPDWPFTHAERAGKIAPEIDALARDCDLMVTGIGD